jgi:hypothetical protein
MSVISRKELLKEILPALDELFGVEYDGKRAIGGNEIVHNVRGYTFDLSLWNGTQGSEEH